MNFTVSRNGKSSDIFLHKIFSEVKRQIKQGNYNFAKRFNIFPDFNLRTAAYSNLN